MIVIKKPVYYEHDPEVPVYISVPHLRVNRALEGLEILDNAIIVKFAKYGLIGHFYHILQVRVCKCAPVKLNSLVLQFLGHYKVI